MKALVLAIGFAFSATVSLATPINSELAVKIAKINPGLPPTAIKKALTYLAEHSKYFDNQSYMTIVNFRQPSTEARLYLINLRTGVTARYYVTHGRNSRSRWNKTMASKFSNTMNSHQTSLGFYRTLGRYENVVITNGNGETYSSTGIYDTGANGRSLRLQGLQSTNSNALNREIVVHGADYVSANAIQELGRLGESSGCPAMSPDVVDSVINRIAGGSLYYAYR